MLKIIILKSQNDNTSGVFVELLVGKHKGIS